MAFRFDSAERLAWALGIRVVLIAFSVLAAVDFLWPRKLYASTVFLGMCAVWLSVSIARRVRRAEERVSQAASVLQTARLERQQQTDYLQTLLDTVAAALIVVKDDGRIELVNRSARTLAGAAVDRLEDMKAIGAPAAGELLALHPGTRQILNLPDGRQMFVSVSQLTSARHGRQLMLSLHAIAGELDAVELKAWKDMAGVLAHEIMNSLTAIASLSESLDLLLRKGREAEEAEVAGALEAIKRRSLGLMDFVERYRMVMDMPAPKMQNLPLEEFLSGIDRLLGPGLSEKGVVFTRSVVPPQLACFADPQLLEQALINLVKNAVDALTDAPHPRIDVACERRKDSMVMTVADNGYGLNDGVAEEPFVPPFTTKPGGTGIGLNLVRQIALSHGGQLEAHRNHPRGSKFALVLPLAG